MTLLLETLQIEENAKVEDRFTLKQLLYQNWDYFLDLYLIYALTLSIFPGFLFENTGEHKLGDWYVSKSSNLFYLLEPNLKKIPIKLLICFGRYAVVLIAMYNVLDLIGRYTPLIKCVKLESRKGLMIAILARFLFVPAFYFTAKYGDQGWMIMLTSLLGFTNGHLTVCVMTVAPKGYKVGTLITLYRTLFCIFLSS